MSTFFVPCTGKMPATISVNGHRLVVLSKDRNVLREGLKALGADSLKQVRGGTNAADEERALNRLAKKIRAGLVIAPANVEIEVIIKNLESQLPWLQ